MYLYHLQNLLHFTMIFLDIAQNSENSSRIPILLQNQSLGQFLAIFHQALLYYAYQSISAFIPHCILDSDHSYLCSFQNGNQA